MELHRQHVTVLPVRPCPATRRASRAPVSDYVIRVACPPGGHAAGQEPPAGTHQSPEMRDDCSHIQEDAYGHMTIPTASNAAPAVRPAVGPGGSLAAPLLGGLDWRTIDWRSHERAVVVNGRRVNLVELGEGPALVFIHGLGGCWQNWLMNIPAAASNHRVIAPDLPGFGASMPCDEISIPGYAHAVASLCDTLEIETATIVGNSMGGFIAAELALSHPEHVRRLVLVDAGGVSTDELYYRPRYMLARVARASWLPRRAQMPTVARRPGLRRLALGLLAHRPERIPADVARTLRDGVSKEGFPAALAMACRHSVRDRLRLIGCPTLIVWGEKDRVVPLRDSFCLQSEIEGSQLVVFPDAGHVPMIEFPRRFNAILTKFTSEDRGCRGARSADRGLDVLTLSASSRRQPTQ
jgi:pimeloyl-ACP methyl ester carboxylesterase